MDNQQRDKVLAAISGLKGHNLAEILKDAFPENELDSVHFHKYSASQLLFLQNKVVINFEKTLATEYASYLPFMVHVVNYGYNGNLTIDQILVQCKNHIDNRDFNNLSNKTDALIDYQILYNFWDNSDRKFHYVESDEILNLGTQLKVIKQEATQEFSNYKKKKEELDSFQNILTQFYKQKEQELKSIADNSTNASNTLQQINNVNSQVHELGGKISSILESQEKLLKESQEKYDASEAIVEDLIKRQNKIIDEIEIDFADRKKGMDVFRESIKKLEKQYKEVIDYANGQKEFLETKEQEIIKLTGQAADGSLGHTFNTRRDTLDKNVVFWRGALVATAIVAIGWAVFVFAFFHDTYSPQWLGVIINFIKTSPGFILLGFCISQYNKERHLQEEYAFKAAVAMTITAYADNIEDPVKKEDLLFQSTQQIYRNPQTLNRKDVPLISFGSKALTESLKDLSESFKNIKS